MGAFTGKNVWITGGASGIGLGVGKLLVGQGVQLSTFDVRLREEALQALSEARRGAPPVRDYALDVTDAEACRRVFRQAATTGGKPDLVLHCAGIVSAVEFERLGYDEWDRVIRVNLYGSRNVASAVLPQLEPGARLALVASLAGLAGGYGYAAYAASKFGVVGLAEVLRVEWKPKGIDVSVVCPPEVETPMVQEERKFRPAATSDMKLFAGSLTVEDAAQQIVDGLAAGRFLVVPGGKGKLTYVLSKYLPRIFSHWVADGIVRRSLAKK